MPAKHFSHTFSVFYGFMSLGMGIQLPFLPIWLGSRGLTPYQIGIVFSAMTATRVLAAPLAALIADKKGNRRAVIILCSFLSFVAYLMLARQESFWPILALAVTAGLVFAPVFPLGEGFGVDGSAEHGLDYGRLRLWASIGFLGGSLLSGALLQVLPIWTSMFMVAAAQGALALVTLSLPADPMQSKPKPERRPGDKASAVFLGGAFPLFMLATGLAQASHGMMNSLGPVIWHSYGFNAFSIGCLWAAAVIGEVLLFACSGRLFEKFGAVNLILIGTAGGLVRWIVLAFASDLAVNLAFQVLHAASFATVHLGTMHYIRLNTPARLRNRAQGLNSALTGGVLMALSMSLSGPLYASFGARGYLAMAAISGVALVFGAMLARVSPKAPALADT
jgi:MFS transporter, PPP family, 3-phenylpropionic acid transporter